MYRALGPLSIFLVWAAGFLLFKKWHQPGLKTMSLVGAQSRRSLALFALSLLVGGGLFYIFAIKWLIPTYNQGNFFKYTLLVALICQIFTALIPDNGQGRRSLIHRIFAFSLAFLLIPLVLMLMSSSAASTLTVLIGLLSVAIMVAVWILFLFVKTSESYLLRMQIAYIVGFHIFILSAVLT